MWTPFSMHFDVEVFVHCNQCMQAMVCVVAYDTVCASVMQTNSSDANSPAEVQLLNNASTQQITAIADVSGCNAQACSNEGD